VFVFLALVFFAIGVIWVSFTYAVVVESKTYRYDNVCAFNSKCTFRFRIEEDMTEPVYLYYRLENYYQNHRRYMRSRSDAQLRGDVIVNDYDAVESDCDPLTSVDDSHEKSAVYLPCGLIATSFFNGMMVLVLLLLYSIGLWLIVVGRQTRWLCVSMIIVEFQPRPMELRGRPMSIHCSSILHLEPKASVSYRTLPIRTLLSGCVLLHCPTLTSSTAL
jgi:hypothetical protein